MLQAMDEYDIDQGDALMEEIGADTPTGTSRLDQVAEMVSSMEQKINNKIDEANKALMDRLEKRGEVQEVTQDTQEITEDDILEESEDNNNEDNRVSD